jgi:membrane protein
VTAGGVRISREQRHGQLANSPNEIPPLGWRDVAARVFHEVQDDRVMLIAAGSTYYMLIALVPGLALFMSIYGLFNDPLTVAKQTDLLIGVLPSGGLSIITDQLTRLAATGRPVLGVTLAISLAVALWSANAGVQSFFEAMNIAYDEAEKRNYFMRLLLGFVFTLGFAIAAILFLTVVVIIPVVMQFLYLGHGFDWLVKVASYALMLVLLMLGISLLYRFGPSRSQAKWRWLTPGAGFAVIGITVVSVAFSWYAANFSNYNATYGSLGALIGFLTWMWLSATVVIVGAEINSELEHQTSRDSTTGAPLPMGARGAYMADHVAAVGGVATDDGKANLAAPPAQVGAYAERRNADRAFMLGITALLVFASAQRGRSTER